MENKSKIGNKIFLALMLVYIATMFILCSTSNAKISELGTASEASLQFSVLSSIQKPIENTNIIFFIVMLGIALWLFAKGAKKMLAYIPLLVFSVFTLFCYASMSGAFFSIGGNDITKSGQYWLMFFIGIFFIVGATCVTLIGTIAVRNLRKRENAESNQTPKVGRK